MKTKLNRIKSALRESIEIAEKATEGPWEKYGNSVWIEEEGSWINCPNLYANAEANATFIANARTMTPLACKALLTAIEGLEWAVKAQTRDMTARNILASITSTWPDA